MKKRFDSKLKPRSKKKKKRKERERKNIGKRQKPKPSLLAMVRTAGNIKNREPDPLLDTHGERRAGERDASVKINHMMHTYYSERQEKGDERS
jgi:hypothetical protein